MEKNAITVEVLVSAPAKAVWQYWTEPQHVTKWNQASEDWHTPHAENDLKVDGRFSFTMAAKDGSMSFDLGGTYTNVQPHKLLEYELDDGRKVQVIFTEHNNETKITQTFEPEGTHPHDFQRQGWHAILESFKRYVESNHSAS